LDECFFIKNEVVNKDGLFCWCNLHNPRVNFDENFLLCLKNFNEKDQIASIFKKFRPNLD